MRAFLNENLRCFTPKHAKSLARKLNSDWQSYLFEIIVGRYLQVLGADVEPEPLGSNGTRVDFRAIFADGAVSVECVSKRFNKQAQETIERHARMARILDNVGPINWAVSFERLPDANSLAEFMPYVERAQEFYGTLPAPEVDGSRFPFAWEGDYGKMQLEAIPFPSGTKANHMGPIVSYMDDSIGRLKAALLDSRKRRQAN